jgi:hypothetical protein
MKGEEVFGVLFFRHVVAVLMATIVLKTKPGPVHKLADVLE